MADEITEAVEVSNEAIVEQARVAAFEDAVELDQEQSEEGEKQVEKEGEDKPAQKETETEADDEKVEVKTEEKQEEKPKRYTRDELAELAAQKKRERAADDELRQRERQMREFEDRDREYKRRQEDLDRREKLLRDDPLKYYTRELGMDQSVAAERIVKGTLDPEAHQLKELVIQQGKQLEALKEQLTTGEKTRTENEQQRHAEAQKTAVYDQFMKISDDKEQFPLMSRLARDERIWYGDRAADLLREAFGRNASFDEIAGQVEHDLQRKFAAAVAGSGSADQSQGSSSKEPGKPVKGAPMTNDLAAENSGNSQDLMDPELRYQLALKYERSAPD